MSFDRREHTTGRSHKIKFLIVYFKMSFLIIRFLVVENYESPKSTSHILSVL